MITYQQELEQITESIQKIPDEKKYWLIRTQKGHWYESFKENGYIALEHRDIDLISLQDFVRENPSNQSRRSRWIREKVTVHQNLIAEESSDSEGSGDEDVSERIIGRVAGQISKFLFNIKNGDTVIIPSANSDLISFGEIVESSFFSTFSQDELRRHVVDFPLKKRVVWERELRRSELDPYLYKMFTAQQAVNDVSGYADVIERSIRDFFILGDDAHTIINVQKTGRIKASELFNFGGAFLDLFDDLAKELNVGVTSQDLDVTIAVNSPGKIDLKSNIKKATVFAGLILAVFGGGFKGKNWKLNTEGVPGLIKAMSDYRDKEAERERAQADHDLKSQIFEQYKDSLEIKDPEEMVKLMKQVSDNRDLPK